MKQLFLHTASHQPSLNRNWGGISVCNYTTYSILGFNKM
jgi:hypothetical protein